MVVGTGVEGAAVAAEWRGQRWQHRSRKTRIADVEKKIFLWIHRGYIVDVELTMIVAGYEAKK